MKVAFIKFRFDGDVDCRGVFFDVVDFVIVDETTESNNVISREQSRNHIVCLFYRGKSQLGVPTVYVCK